MNLLKLQSQKVLAHHLLFCTKMKEDESSPQGEGNTPTSTWKCQTPHKSFNISPLIWIQGTVVQIQDSGETVMVDDGSGIIVLNSCNRISSKITITKGMYIMAVGSLQLGGQRAVMTPIKLQDLSHVDHAEIMWPLEVIDQMIFLND